MKKEIIILLIFLFQINAENSSYFGNCLKENGKVLRNGMVCIHKKDMVYMQWPPFGYAKLSITLSNVQIIKIGSNEITVSMNTRIEWTDYRLTFEAAKVLLTVEEQNQVWSPKIVIGTNMMSETKEAEEIEVNYNCINNNKWCWESLVKTFFLHTTVKCEMDFQTFPFDNHTCNIEVNLIFFAT